MYLIRSPQRTMLLSQNTEINTSCCFAHTCSVEEAFLDMLKAVMVFNSRWPAKKPFLIPSDEGIFKEYEEFGVEDPRITFLEGEYLITYNAYSRNGVRIGLAKTKDFRTLKRFSLITEADYRNAVIFPEKFNGLYARLDRPHSEISPWSVWISYSPYLPYY